MSGYYRLRKRIYGVYDIRTKLQEKKRPNIELSNTHVARRHNSSNKGGQRKTVEKFFLEYLKNSKKPDRERTKQIQIQSQGKKLVGAQNKQKKTITNREKIKTILQSKSPTSSKELNSFLRAIQKIAKFPDKLSKKTRPNESFIKKEMGTEMDPKRRREFQ